MRETWCIVSGEGKLKKELRNEGQEIEVRYGRVALQTAVRYLGLVISSEALHTHTHTHRTKTTPHLATSPTKYHTSQTKRQNPSDRITSPSFSHLYTIILKSKVHRVGRSWSL